MSNIIPFSFEDQEIRFWCDDLTFEVVAPDLVKALYPEAPKENRSQYLKKVSAKYKGNRKIDTLGGEQEVTTLKESGFYQFIARSNSPKAEPFQDWLYEDVLPTIRRTGGYSIKPQPTPAPVQLELTLNINQVQAVAIPCSDKLYTIAEYADILGVFLTNNQSAGLGTRAANLYTQTFRAKPSRCSKRKVSMYPTSVLNLVFAGIEE